MCQIGLLQVSDDSPLSDLNGRVMDPLSPSEVFIPWVVSYLGPVSVLQQAADWL